MKDDIKDKKILIPLDGSYKEFNKYKKAFKDKKIWNRFVFLIDNDLNKNVFKDTNYHQIDIANIEPNIERCEEILKKCEFEGNFDSFCVVEYFQNRTKFKNSKIHKNDCAKKLIYLYDNLHKVKYDYVLYNLVSHFFPRAVQLIAKKHGKSVYGYTQSLVPGKEYIWLDDEMHSSIELQRLVNGASNITTSNTTVMNEVVRRKKNKTYMAVFGRSILQEITSLYAVRSRFKPSSFTRSRILFFIEKFFLRKIKAFLWKSFAVKKIPSEKFIFFPLHMPGEAQTLVRGYPFINDVEVLYQLSLIIPSNIQIVVKEHPGYEGWKSLQELNLIKIMPNVTLVDSDISSHDLIERSDFVITINSSVWFESLAFNKNVVTLGRGIFSGLNVTHEAKTFSELDSLVKKLINNSEQMNIPKDRIEKFIDSYSKMSVTGEMYRYTSSENDNFAKLIQNKIKLIESS